MSQNPGIGCSVSSREWRCLKFLISCPTITKVRTAPPSIALHVQKGIFWDPICRLLDRKATMVDSLTMIQCTNGIACPTGRMVDIFRIIHELHSPKFVGLVSKIKASKRDGMTHVTQGEVGSNIQNVTKASKLDTSGVIVSAAFGILTSATRGEGSPMIREGGIASTSSHVGACPTRADYLNHLGGLMGAVLIVRAFLDK